MKKLFALSLMGLILTLAGCSLKAPGISNNSNQSTTEQNVNAPAKVTDESGIVTTSSKSNSTEILANNWQTYRNDKYGFEFMYPKGWTLEEKALGSNTYSIELRRYTSVKKDRFDGLVQIVIKSSTSTGGSGDKPDLISSDQVDIDGQTAVRKIESWSPVSKENLSYKMNLKNNPNSSITLSVYGYDGEHGYSISTYNDLLDELMKTFKFIK